MEVKFSTRTTYGLRAMINLAKNVGSGSVSLSQIAKEEQISKSYLERLFAGLKKAGLIKSEKGASGGYKLSRPAGKINMFEIIKTLEGKMSPFRCVDEKGKIYCSDKSRCGASQVLIKVQQAVNKTLKSISLKDLVK